MMSFHKIGLALLFALLSSCDRSAAPSSAPSKEMKTEAGDIGPAPSDAKESKGPDMNSDKPPYPAFLSPQMLATVRACPQWEVAALRCESIEIKLKGSRSQRMALTAKVASSSGSVPESLQIDQYVGGDVFMAAQGDYLVALCTSEEGWNVISWQSLGPGDPASEVSRAQSSIEARLAVAED